MNRVKKGKFIVCEGLDCSGKTSNIISAFEYLSNSNLLYGKALKTNNPLGKLAKKFPSTLTLLMEIDYLNKSFVKPNLDKGMSILQDRWYYSVLSHNPVNKNDLVLSRNFVPYLQEPDMLIYFTVSLDERLKRLEKSPHERDHKILLENPDIIVEREKRFMKYFDEFQGNKIIFDTTHYSREENAKKLYKIIEKEINDIKKLSVSIPKILGSHQTSVWATY
jgi:dTMP kinase